MDDLGLNKWLVDHYGKTIDGLPLFKVTWSTGITEKRYGEFHDYMGDIFIRCVREVREVLKYPYAQNRWILEKIRLVSNEVQREYGIETKFTYEPIYTFQDKDGNYLPLVPDKLEAAMFLYLKFYLMMTPKERIDFRIAGLAARDLEKRKLTREILGDSKTTPSALVIERAAGIDRKGFKKNG